MFLSNRWQQSAELKLKVKSQKENKKESYGAFPLALLGSTHFFPLFHYGVYLVSGTIFALSRSQAGRADTKTTIYPCDQQTDWS